MQISYINALIKILDDLKKTYIFACRWFFNETPFKNDTECNEIKKYFEECFSKNLTVIKSSENLKIVGGRNCYLIINGHFSTIYSNQIDFINEVLKK